MADKRKYWIKIEKDFLKSTQIKVIKAMPNGKDYILFYLALMLESVETVGHLRFNELVPYNEEMLSAITDTNIDVVRSALKLFSEIGLIQVLEDSTIFLPSVPMLTGSETDSAERVRKYRAKKEVALLHCNTDETNCNANKEKEEEKKKKKQEEIKRIQREKDILEIVDYLNLVCKTHYKETSKQVIKFITARLDEDFTVEDFKTVIVKKYEQWKDTEQQKYLRPETLFGTKFESYLNEHYVPRQRFQKRTQNKADALQDALSEVYAKIEREENDTERNYGISDNEFQLFSTDS